MVHVVPWSLAKTLIILIFRAEDLLRLLNEKEHEIYLRERNEPTRKPRFGILNQPILLSRTSNGSSTKVFFELSIHWESKSTVWLSGYSAFDDESIQLRDRRPLLLDGGISLGLFLILKETASFASSPFSGVYGRFDCHTTLSLSLSLSNNDDGQFLKRLWKLHVFPIFQELHKSWSAWQRAPFRNIIPNNLVAIWFMRGSHLQG